MGRRILALLPSCLRQIDWSPSGRPPPSPPPDPCLPPTLGRRCHWGLAELWVGPGEERPGQCALGAACVSGCQGPRAAPPSPGPLVMVATCCSARAIKGSLAFSTYLARWPGPVRSSPSSSTFLLLQENIINCIEAGERSLLIFYFASVF